MKYKCATCKSHKCYTEGKDCTDIPTEEVIAVYRDDEMKMMEAAAYVEATFYSNITRLQDTA